LGGLKWHCLSLFKVRLRKLMCTNQFIFLVASFCHFLKNILTVYCCLLFTILCPFGTKESIRQKVDHGGPLVLATCHKLGQGNRVRSLHELSKNARVGEGQGRTKTFSNFLCIWTDKEQVFFILYLPQVAASTKPLCVWHTLPRT
jgi:hypothetical protein